MDEQKILGLIAGNGKFPILFAREARKKGFKVIAVAVKGDTSFLIKPFVSKIFWLNPGELKKMFSIFRENAVRQVIMAGQVNPDNLFDPKVALDEEFKSLFAALKDRKADTIFSAVAQRLKKEGMELLNSTFLLDEYLASKGTLTRRGPTENELADIEFGRNIAKAMGLLDVGQTVVVKDRAILAIEAMEGTDHAILRGGVIARFGAVVVKTAKPSQDERFDIPVIGPTTIKTMIKCKAACLAVDAGRTLIIDQQECTRLADRGKICILAS